MKKLLFIGALVAIGVTMQSANITSPLSKIMLSEHGKISDTIDHDTNTVVTLTKELDMKGYSQVMVKVMVDRISDTVNGTVYIKSSLYDGDYERNTGIVDSFVLTDVARQTYTFNLGAQKAKFYQLEFASGSSEMEASVQGYIERW